MLHTIKHDRRGLRHLANVSSLFLELADGSLLGRLTLVDESRRDFDADLVNGRTVLFLEDDFGAGGLLEDGDNADAVNLAVLGAGAALGGFPGASVTVLVVVVDLDELDPASLALALRFYGSDRVRCSRLLGVSYVGLPEGRWRSLWQTLWTC